MGEPYNYYIARHICNFSGVFIDVRGIFTGNHGFRGWFFQQVLPEDYEYPEGYFVGGCR
jgi:hypothetical protein